MIKNIIPEIFNRPSKSGSVFNGILPITGASRKTSPRSARPINQGRRLNEKAIQQAVKERKDVLDIQRRGVIKMSLLLLSQIPFTKAINMAWTETVNFAGINLHDAEVDYKSQTEQELANFANSKLDDALSRREEKETTKSTDSIFEPYNSKAILDDVETVKEDERALDAHLIMGLSSLYFNGRLRVPEHLNHLPLANKIETMLENIKNVLKFHYHLSEDLPQTAEDLVIQIVDDNSKEIRSGANFPSIQTARISPEQVRYEENTVAKTHIFTNNNIDLAEIQERQRTRLEADEHFNDTAFRKAYREGHSAIECLGIATVGYKYDSDILEEKRFVELYRNSDATIAKIFKTAFRLDVTNPSFSFTRSFGLLLSSAFAYRLARNNPAIIESEVEQIHPYPRPVGPDRERQNAEKIRSLRIQYDKLNRREFLKSLGVLSVGAGLTLAAQSLTNAFRPGLSRKIDLYQTDKIIQASASDEKQAEKLHIEFETRLLKLMDKIDEGYLARNRGRWNSVTLHDNSFHSEISDETLIHTYGEGKYFGIDTAPYLARALILFEDRDFYSHNGVSTSSLAKAIFRNIKGTKSGGSTLSAQWVKNIVYDREEVGLSMGSYTRKIFEMMLAEIGEQYVRRKIAEEKWGLEENSRDHETVIKRDAKEFIMEQLWAHTDYGLRTSGAAFGAKELFGKRLDEISPLQQVYMAFIPNAPQYFGNPDQNVRDKFVENLKIILQRFEDSTDLSDPGHRDFYNKLYDEGQDFLNGDDQFRQEVIPNYPSLSELLERISSHPANGVSPYAKPILERAKKLGDVDVQLKTTINSETQKRLEESVNSARASLESQEWVRLLGDNKPTVDALVIDVQKRSIKASVGNPQKATPVGSVLKPLIYAWASYKGVPEDIIIQEHLGVPGKLHIAFANQSASSGFAVHDFTTVPDGESLSMNSHMIYSTNSPFARIATYLGLNSMKKFFEDIGITKRDRDKKPTVLDVLGGHHNFSLSQLGNAYTGLFEGGVILPIQGIQQIKVKDADGTTRTQDFKESGTAITFSDWESSAKAISSIDLNKIPNVP